MPYIYSQVKPIFAALWRTRRASRSDRGRRPVTSHRSRDPTRVFRFYCCRCQCRSALASRTRTRATTRLARSSRTRRPSDSTKGARRRRSSWPTLPGAATHRALTLRHRHQPGLVSPACSRTRPSPSATSAQCDRAIRSPASWSRRSRAT